MPTLLALHAHPDDEASKGAGTVARYTDEGVRAVLVTATGGEEGDILNPAMDRPGIAERLPEIRSAELHAAAAILGYDEVIMLGYRDSGMPGTEANARPDAFVNAAPDDVLERIVTVVRRVRPDIMLGYDDHEWYQHPDHVRVHDVSLEVFAASADPARFPDAGPAWEIAKLYAPVFSVERITRLHTAMEQRGLDSPFARWLDRVDGAEPTDRAITRIAVGSYIERGRDALRAHRTQVDPDGFWFQVPTEIVQDVYPYEDFELLASRVGPDTADDDLFSRAEAGVR